MKSSTVKPLRNPPPGDKHLGLETAICFCELEEGDNTKEGEDAEILIIQDKILASTKQNLIKRKLPYIDTFDKQVAAVACAMRDLTRRVF